MKWIKLFFDDLIMLEMMTCRDVPYRLSRHC